MTIDAPPRDPRWRILALLCAACAALTLIYGWTRGSRRGLDNVALAPVVRGLEMPPVDGREAPKPAPPSAAGELPTVVAPAGAVARVDPAVFLVRHTGRDRSFGLLAVDPGDAVPGPRRATSLACERVHFAAGHGVCLVAGRPLLTSYSAVLFDGAFTPRQTLPLDGIPSRTRVSPDGRFAAITVFTGGHSYADNDFATATSIINAETGATIVANMEDLEIVRDGEPFKAIDFNFWGVTFAADGDRFYATLGTGGASYLIEGRVASATARIVRAGVECPALSPDNRRLAFKKPLRTGATRRWRLATLDLVTLQDTELAETRSVDDQVEWLDDTRILYGVAEGSGADAPTAVWVVPADGTGRAERFLNDASSPTVVRR